MENSATLGQAPYMFEPVPVSSHSSDTEENEENTNTETRLKDNSKTW
jgi:hypothetical protein